MTTETTQSAPPQPAPPPQPPGKPQPAPRGRLRTKILPMAIVLAAVGAVAAISRIPKRDHELPPREVPAVDVTTVRITPRAEMLDTIVLPGVIEPRRVVRLASEVAGQIEQIPAVEGTPVHAGEAIVRLNTDLAQADYDRTAGQLEFDRGELARLESLYRRGVATAKEMEEARSKVAVGEASLRGDRERLDRAKVVAPVGGVLNKLPVEVGEYVQPGTVVAEIVDVDKMKVQVDVPEQDVHYFSLGTGVSPPRLEWQHGAGLDRDEAWVRQGEITYISQLADELTRTTRMEVTIDNADRRFRSGQIVRVHMARRKLTGVIMIPLRAVIPQENDRVVYVAEGGVARQLSVKLGFIKGSEVQVLDPPSDAARRLRAGDALIVEGQRFLSDGQKVLVASVESAADSGGQTAAAAAEGAPLP